MHLYLDGQGRETHIWRETSGLKSGQGPSAPRASMAMEETPFTVSRLATVSKLTNENNVQVGATVSDCAFPTWAPDGGGPNFAPRRSSSNLNVSLANGCAHMSRRSIVVLLFKCVS